MLSQTVYSLHIGSLSVQLLPQKAAYIPSLRSLLVSDIHLGKAETFQHFGIPISSQVNGDSLTRLLTLCRQLAPQRLFILGDLVHSRHGWTDPVQAQWQTFVQAVDLEIVLIVGNHDRHSIGHTIDQIPPYTTAWHESLQVQCVSERVQLEGLILSHDPYESAHLEESYELNICGHIHPCLRLKSRLDDLRLPCFFLERVQNRLILPSFGTFTGGYDIDLRPETVAYGIVDDRVIAFAGKP